MRKTYQAAEWAKVPLYLSLLTFISLTFLLGCLLPKNFLCVERLCLFGDAGRMACLVRQLL